MSATGDAEALTRRWKKHDKAPLGPLRDRAHPRIRFGYFSADLQEHATAYLMAELFERHDRGRFEIVAFSFGPNQDDAMRRRIDAAFDRFIDVRTTSTARSPCWRASSRSISPST